MTLAEVLVAASISLLLLGLTVTIWILASQAWGKTYRQQTAQQSNLVSLTRVREDYRRARPGSAILEAGVLSFLVYQDGSGEVAWDSKGDTLWRGWVQYRWDGGLQRRFSPLPEFVANPSNAPPAWPTSQAGQKLAPQLISWTWNLRGNCLEVVAASRYEGVQCTSQLRVMPHLYQPD